MDPMVKLLGRPAIAYDGTIRPAVSKSTAALCYLAYQGEWVSRDDMLYLFWPDSDEMRARRNLRQLLSTMRRLPYTGGLQFEADRLCWEVSTDVKSFREAVGQQRHAQAVELYEGPLLRGLHLQGAPEFDSWLELERGELHELWRQSVLALSDDLIGQGRGHDASELLERLLKIEPFDETVLRQLLLNLEPSEALRRFRRYQSELEQELGGLPEPQTLRLIEEIGRPEVTAGKAGSASAEPLRLALPQTPTAFVGRIRELELLDQYMSSDDCRLLTILGTGGMGKTRLAIEVGSRLRGRFADGACFVPLAGVTSTDGIAPEIALALGVQLQGGADPIAQMLAFLRNKELLLILDNLEQLSDMSRLILELLNDGPGLRILATSRQRLNLKAEWVYDIEGLSYPDVDRVDGAREFEAVQLFQAAAKRGNVAFAVTSQNERAVARICRLTAGMPLAIELAASWLRVMTVDDIADELQRGLDLLVSSEEDVAERHRSVRAAFDHSWRLLSEGERKALRRLSVFQGGFDRIAAQKVAEAGLPLLLALRNKSFLTRDTNGRFSPHPLLGQYLRERAEEQSAELEAARRRHAEISTDLMVELQTFLEENGQRSAFERMEPNYGNFVLAWRWATQNRREDLVYLMAGTQFHEYVSARGSDVELERLLGEALAGVEKGSRAWGRLNRLEAIRLWRLERHDEAYKCAKRSVEAHHRVGSDADFAFALGFLGVTAAHLNRLEEAQRLWRESLDAFRRLGRTHWITAALGNFAVITVDLQECERLYQEAIVAHRATGARHASSTHFLNYARLVATSYGDYSRAQELIDEGIALERDRLGDRFKFAASLNFSASLRLMPGELKSAEIFAKEALSLVADFYTFQASRVRSKAMAVLAWICFLQGDIDSARGLTNAHLAGSKDNHLWLFARLALASNEVERARRTASEILARTAKIPDERLKRHERANAFLLLAEAHQDEPNLAQTHLREALKISCRYTFIPLVLEALLVAATHIPAQRASDLLWIAATHPAATFETRKRARKLASVVTAPGDGAPLSLDKIIALGNEVLSLID